MWPLGIVVVCGLCAIGVLSYANRGWCEFDSNAYGIKPSDDFLFRFSRTLLKNNEPFRLESGPHGLKLSMRPIAAGDRKKMDNLLSETGAYD